MLRDFATPVVDCHRPRGITRTMKAASLVFDLFVACWLRFRLSSKSGISTQVPCCFQRASAGAIRGTRQECSRHPFTIRPRGKCRFLLGRALSNRHHCQGPVFLTQSLSLGQSGQFTERVQPDRLCCKVPARHAKEVALLDPCCSVL